MVKGSIRHPGPFSEPPSPQGRDWERLDVICGENRGSRGERRTGRGLAFGLSRGKGRKVFTVLLFYVLFSPLP